MEIFKIVETLESLSEELDAYKLGSPFAQAVTEAASLLVGQREQIADLENKLEEIKEQDPGGKEMNGVIKLVEARKVKFFIADILDIFGISVGDRMADRLLRVTDTLPAVEAVILPFKVGQTVYRMLPHEDFVMECTVAEYSITNDLYMVLREVQFNARRGMRADEAGKTVFQTRQEAENAIKERRRMREEPFD